jgi:hypothetical protein
MARTTDQVDDRLASVRRARIDTQHTITRKLTEIAALRTAYANEGRLIDKLLDERMDAAVAQAMADTATPDTATPPAPPPDETERSVGLLARYAAGAGLPRCTCDHTDQACPTCTRRDAP